MYLFLIYAYNSLSNQKKLRGNFIKNKYGIKIIKSIFRHLNKQYDTKLNEKFKEEVHLEERYAFSKEVKSDVSFEEEKKSFFSDMKSDVFQESGDKTFIQINEWFTLLLILLTHNINVKELGKQVEENDEQNQEEEGKKMQKSDSKHFNTSNHSEEKKAPPTVLKKNSLLAEEGGMKGMT
mmetsp:Transcript_11637/g.11567  ORF Transcript_11637/g.11567 Transcript_11637/m.11567 type:complete len:180 (+) Transcript_11637:103-642(+)